MILVTLIINIIIFYYLDTIARFVNTYDVPDKKLKIHKRKNSITGWYYFNDKLFIIFFIARIFEK